MKISSLSKYGLGLLAAAGILAGCSGNMSSPTSAVPGVGGVQSSHVAGPARMVPAWLPLAQLHPSYIPAKKKGGKGGIYVSSFGGSDVYGFPAKGGAENCTIDTGAEAINGIATDPKGNLVLPEGDSRSVVVYSGPKMCGAEAGSFADSNGQPSDASTSNAATGTIAIGNITTGSSTSGSLSLCTLKSGCSTNLTNSAITGYGGGVLMDSKGNCYLTYENASFTGSGMVYWAGCKGAGVSVTGWKNTYYGSITLDKKGNIDALDFEGGGTGQLWVYSGCNPACKLVGGPFALKGYSIFGAANKKGNMYGAVEFETGEVDLYTYSPTKVTYKSSFASGFSASEEAEGFAYNPAVK